MRCNNCGWENPSGKEKCEKCNAPLSGSMIGHKEVSQRRYASVAEELRGTVPESGSVPADTGSNHFSPSSGGEMSGKGVICPYCSYPVSPVMNTCPNCGKALKQQPEDDGPVERQRVSGRAENTPCRPVAPKPGKTCPECGGNISMSDKFCPGCGASLRMGTVSAWDTPRQGGFCTLKPLPWKGEEVVYQPISYSGTQISLNRGNTDANNNTITSKEQAVLIQEADGWYIEDRSELHTTFVRADRRRKLENGDVIVLGNRLFEFKG